MIMALALLAGIANPATYLLPISQELAKEWPGNRTVTVVCHGHSVPAGYFATPVVQTMDAYPHLLHAALSRRFPHAVINVIVTAIGGENSISGEARFARDVSPLRPDVVTIDYSLNDRGLDMAKAEQAWTSMVREAKAAGARVLLLTPTPDLGSNILDEGDVLSRHAAQVRRIAAREEVGLVDSYVLFQDLAKRSEKLETYMSQSNHPNRKGHEQVSKAILDWFPEVRK